MSVYNVISNSYTDLLNTLRADDVANNGLANLFTNITPEKKRSIINQLADTMVQFDTAFNAEILYWESVRKEQLFFFIGYIILTVVFGIGIIIGAIYSVMTLKSKDTLSLIQVIIRFVLVFHVMLCVMILLLMNSRTTLKYTDGQMVLMTKDSKEYSNYIFQGASRDDMAKFFLFIGYYKRNTPGRYKRLHNELSTSPSYNGILELFHVNDKPTVVSESRTASMEVQVYNALKDDIQNSLIKFYNGGQGYIDAKKKVILASPVMMLKEVKRIMKYYMSLGYKNLDETTFSSTKETNEKKIIDSTVVKPIADLIGSTSSAVTQPTPQQIQEAESLNANNDKYKVYYNRLMIAFSYMAVFSYPIYVGKLPEAPDFNPAAILNSMPYRINVDQYADENEKEFYKEIRQTFLDIKSKGDYERYVTSVSLNKDNRDAAIKQVCDRLTTLFGKLYFNVFYHIKGTLRYPFLQTYIIDAIKINYSPAAKYFDQAYLDKVTLIMYESIVVPVSASFDILAVKKGILIDELTKSLVDTNINLVTYQNYVISKVISDTTNNGKRYVNDIVELLNQVQQKVAVERQLTAKTNAAKKSKFNDIDEFSKRIDNMSYNNYVERFEIEYLKDVVDKFYSNISKSVAFRTPNQQNLYYYRQRSLDFAKSYTTMIIIALIMIYIIFALYIVTEFWTLEKKEGKTPCEEAAFKKKYTDSVVNCVIKLIFPFFIVIFAIAMLVAIYKNRKGKFEFNLEIIETNTNALKTLLDEFSQDLAALELNLDSVDRMKNISLVSKITFDDKKIMLDRIVNIVDRYEKCNYIIEAGNKLVPFPYTDIITYALLLIVAVACIIYLLITFKPLQKIKDLKMLYKLREQVLITNDLAGLKEKMKSISVCHTEDMDVMVVSFKILFACLICIFLIYYSVKIIGSSNDFKHGLYNSTYFSESKCYGT